MKVNFTKKTIEKLPVPTGRRAVWQDSQVRGLYIAIQPTGYRAFFWVRKTRFGKLQWRNLGVFPDLSIEQARANAIKLSSQLASWKAGGFQGDDPFQSREIPTFGQLLDDYNEHVKGHAAHPDKAAKNVKWMINKYVPSWKSKPVDAITREDVRGLHKQIGVKHRVSANRIVTLIRAIYYFAEESDVRGVGKNPCRGIQLFHEDKRARFLQPAELPRFFEALKHEPSRDLSDFTKLALWTGARRSDIFGMRWKDISLDDNRWQIPSPKNRVPYVVALVPEAIEILRERAERAKKKESTKDSPWVFPGVGRSGHLVDLKSRWSKLLERAGIDNLHIHDLRRTLASFQAAQGSSIPIIGKSLGHASSASTMVYARLDLEPVRASVAAATQAMIAAANAKQLGEKNA